MIIGAMARIGTVWLAITQGMTLASTVRSCTIQTASRMPSPAPTTAMAYPSARPGRRPTRPIRRASGQLASAPPSAPSATGRPDQVLLPVIAAAMMLPTARLIVKPVLALTWAAKSVAMSARRREGGGVIRSILADSATSARRASRA